jgi:hypothetical protein
MRDRIAATKLVPNRKEQKQINIDQIEIILLMDGSLKGEIGGAPIWLEGDANLFAVHTGADCVRIGAISEQSQTECDLGVADLADCYRQIHGRPRCFSSLGKARRNRSALEVPRPRCPRRFIGLSEAIKREKLCLESETTRNGRV